MSHVSSRTREGGATCVHVGKKVNKLLDMWCHGVFSHPNKHFHNEAVLITLAKKHTIFRDCTARFQHFVLFLFYIVVIVPIATVWRKIAHKQEQ